MKPPVLAAIGILIASANAHGQAPCDTSNDVDLAVEIEAPSGPFLEGNTFLLTVEVRNMGSSGTASGRTVALWRSDAKPRARVRSRVPVSLSPSISSGRNPPGREIDRRTVDAGLCPGESRSLQFGDSPPRAGDWSYHAVLSGDDPDGANDMDSIEITVRSGQPPMLQVLRPDLNPAVTQSHTDLPPNETMTYTVQVENEGGAAASEVSVRNEFSENLDFVSVQATHGFECLRTGILVTCDDGDLPAGATATITIRARLPMSANPGHSLVFGTQADPDDAIEETNENNNTAGAFAQTAPPPLVEHAVSSGHVMDVARERGYIFEDRVQPLRNGWCDIQMNNEGTDGYGFSRQGRPRYAALRAAHLEDVRQVPTCEFRLFQGGKLSPGWSMKVELAEKPGFVSSTHPTSWTSDPSFVVVIQSTGACGDNEPLWDCYRDGAMVYDITLRGPEGQNWPAAIPQQ